MDFNTRASQPAPANSGAPFGGATNKKGKAGGSKWLRWGSIVLFVAVVVLVVAALVAFAFGGQKPEGSYVDSKKLQAVFLNTGQVYFGDVTFGQKHIKFRKIIFQIFICRF